MRGEVGAPISPFLYQTGVNDRFCYMKGVPKIERKKERVERSGKTAGRWLEVPGTCRDTDIYYEFLPYGTGTHNLI